MRSFLCVAGFSLSLLAVCAAAPGQAQEAGSTSDKAWLLLAFDRPDSLKSYSISVLPFDPKTGSTGPFKAFSGTLKMAFGDERDGRVRPLLMELAPGSYVVFLAGTESDSGSFELSSDDCFEADGFRVSARPGKVNYMGDFLGSDRTMSLVGHDVGRAGESLTEFGGSPSAILKVVPEETTFEHCP